MASYGLLKMGDNNRIDITPDRVHQVEGATRGRRAADARRGQPRRRRRADVRHAAAADGFVGLPRTTRVRRLRPGHRTRSTRTVACSALTSWASKATRATRRPTRPTRRRDRLLSENVDVIIGAASSSVTPVGASTRSRPPASRCSRRPTPRRSCRPTPTRACTSVPLRPTCTRATCSASSWSNDGNQTVAIINLNDSYGNGLAEAGCRDHHRVGWRGRLPEDVRPGGDVVRQRDRRDRCCRPRRDPRDRLQRVVEDPADDGRKGRRPAGQGRLRLRRQHRQRPRRRLRRRQLTANLTPRQESARGPGRDGSGPFSSSGRRAQALGERAEVELDHLGVGEQLAPVPV